jgi:hypothetical protein
LYTALYISLVILYRKWTGAREKAFIARRKGGSEKVTGLGLAQKLQDGPLFVLQIL